MLVLPTLFGLLAFLPQEPAEQEWLPLEAPPSDAFYGVEYWGVHDGLPQVQVNALAMDAHGLMHLGTHAGLVTFDGARFELIGELDDKDLQAMYILSLHFDDRGRLWIGTEKEGVGILDGENSRWLKTPPEFGEATKILEIAFDQDGHAWVGCDRGVIEYSPEGVPLQHRVIGEIHDIAFSPDGSTYLAGEKLWQLQSNELTPLDESGFSSVHVSSDGDLWAADRESRIIRFETDGSWTRWTHDLEGGIYEILETEEGTIWFGTWNPIEFRDGAFYTALLERRTQPNIGLGAYALLYDREGTLWLGGGGLTAFRKRPLWAAQIESFRSNTPRIVLEDRLEPGFLWLADFSGRLHRSQPGGGFVIHPDHSADSLATGPDGATYAASQQHGLQRLTAEDKRTVIEPDAFLPGRSLALLPDGPLQWWVSAGDSLMHFDQSKICTVWTADQGLDLGEIHKLACDPSGTLWIGARSGVALLRDGEIVAVHRAGDSIAHGPVREIYFCENGTAWLGHNGGGLSMRRPEGNWRVVTRDDGLHENIVHAILGNADGGMTLLGNQGISRLSAEDVRAFESGTSKRLHPRVFDQAPGASVFEGMGGAMPAGSHLADGNMVFAAFQHVVWFQNELAAVKLPPPIVQLKSLKAGEVSYDLAKENRLGPELRDLVIRYHANSYTDRHLLRFQRQLVGHDAEWIDIGTTEVAHYSNVPPGTYRFRVRAANRDGVWSEVITSAPFTLQPTLLELAWFRAALAGTLLVALAWAIAVRFRTQRRARNELEILVNERTSDLQAARDQLETEVAGRTRDLRLALEQLQADMSERERLQEQMRRTERLEALGRLTHGVAHEFNNILTAVLGEAEMGLGRADSPDQRRRFERIRDAGERATELTDQTLSLSHTLPSTGNRIRFDEEVRRTVSLVRALLPRSLKVTCNYGAGESEAETSASQLGLIVMNLLINARDASRADGRIQVSTELDGNSLRLIVEDEGEGIAPELREKIFDPFFTTKEPGVGTGLGLASVLGAVERAGGRVVFDSEVGKGTRFEVTLPLAQKSSAAIDAAEGSRIRQPTVLLCDDEPGVLEVMQASLAEAPISTLTAANPREALRLIRAHDEPIDLLITDSVMPGMTGDELAEAARALCPSLHVAFVSGYSQSGMYASGTADQAAPFLNKPFRPDEFRAFVTRMLSSSPEPAGRDSQ